MVRSQRARLFDAIARAVSERGYAATPVVDVTGLLVTEVLRAYGEPGAWEDRLRGAMRTLLHLLAAEPAFARMCLVEVLAAGEEAMRHHSAMLGRFVPTFADGHADPAAASSVVVQAIIAGIVGIVHGEIVAGRAAGLPSLLPQIMFFAVAQLSGLEAARRHLEIGAGIA